MKSAVPMREDGYAGRYNPRGYPAYSGRLRGLFRLPVDQQEKALALWRFDHPLANSGEPGTRPHNQDTPSARRVQEKTS